MADVYNRGEAVYCWRYVKNQAGNYVNPATSFTITITDPKGTVVVNVQSMVPDDTGKFHYTYSIPAAANRGYYLVKYVATDDTYVTIKYTGFIVE